MIVRYGRAKIQADFPARLTPVRTDSSGRVGQAGMQDISSVELFLCQNRRVETELSRTLLVELQARRYESFRLNTLCRPDSYREGDQDS